MDCRYKSWKGITIALAYGCLQSLGICQGVLSDAKNQDAQPQILNLFGKTFSDTEKKSALEYWSETGRYRAEVPSDWMKSGLWQVRLTVEGSKWLWNYNRIRGTGKPSSTPAPPPIQVSTETARAWDNWISAKVDWDRFVAVQEADKLNQTVIPGIAAKVSGQFIDPGLPSADLIAAAGNPPKFADCVVPLQHVISFEDGAEIVYVDNIRVSPKNAYYRFEKGVISGGIKVRSMPEKSLKVLFRDAGVSEDAFNVMAAVSLLEGGFDSVNTYDTGFVSVGLIQFASLKEGGGSLGRLLKRFKLKDPKAFESCFSRFGVSVTEEAKIAVLDLETGAELIGPDANLKIIEDKRLIAVFQHAGQKSEVFQQEQIRSAASDYYPGSDVIEISIGGKAIKVRVSDFVKSEAGMATLMDRKVNTGTLNPLPLVLVALAQEKGIQPKEFEQSGAANSPFGDPTKQPEVVSPFAKYEREIIVKMKFRRDFLADPKLTQPKNSK